MWSRRYHSRADIDFQCLQAILGVLMMPLGISPAVLFVRLIHMRDIGWPVAHPGFDEPVLTGQ
jgi:hypothetical protein